MQGFFRIVSLIFNKKETFSLDFGIFVQFFDFTLQYTFALCFAISSRYIFFACGDPNTNADLGIEKLQTRKEEKRFAGSFSWVLETCMRTRIKLKVVSYGRVCGENYLRVTGELGQH